MAVEKTSSPVPTEDVSQFSAADDIPLNVVVTAVVGDFIRRFSGVDNAAIESVVEHWRKTRRL